MAGDQVMLKHGDRALPAQIVEGSQDGRLLVVAFDGTLGAFKGAMPLLRWPSGAYRALPTDELVTLEPVESRPDA